MTLAVLGISFRTAPVELREQAAVSAERVPELLRLLRARFPDGELVLLSTCNRTELYAAGIDVPAQRHRLAQVLLQAGAPAVAEGVEDHFYVKQGLEAAEHLLAVAAGLDAMVVGETEILGQVKQAFAQARAARTAGKRLHPLFQNAFRVAKRVYTETDICRGRVSVSSLAVEFAEKVFDHLDAKTAMIVGAGETAELALKSLIDRGTRHVLVLNRSLERGRDLAVRYGGRAIPFERLDEYLPRADIVISSTGAPHFVIRPDAVQRAINVRRGRPVLMVDIAVPRDIDPAAGGIENVYVYAIDDLKRVAEENLSRRRDAVEQAWRIVRQGTAEVAPLVDGGGLQDLLRRLDEQGREATGHALRRALDRGELAGLPASAREEIRVLANRIVNRMLAEPRRALRRAAGTAAWEDYARVVNDLFGFRHGEGEDGTAAGETSGKDKEREPA